LSPASTLLKEIGLDRWPDFLGDRLFNATVFAAAIIWVIFWFTVIPTFTLQGESIFFIVFIGAVWSPIVEEILFRGIVQGKLTKKKWGRVRFLNFSRANWFSSALFVLAHFWYQPGLSALTLLAPSLIFGFFRDRYANTFPCIFLHSYFNAGFILINIMAQYPG
jgi:membrane protease YdiL (CAAX protease family)